MSRCCDYTARIQKDTHPAKSVLYVFSSEKKRFTPCNLFQRFLSFWARGRDLWTDTFFIIRTEICIVHIVIHAKSPDGVHVAAFYPPTIVTPIILCVPNKDSINFLLFISFLYSFTVARCFQRITHCNQSVAVDNERNNLKWN